MNYTSYFGNLRNIPEDVVPISIALYPIKNWSGKEYRKLAPSCKMLDIAKSGNVEESKRLYREYLDTLNVDSIVEELQELADYNDFVLLCYERPDDYCHRHVVREWLRDNGYDCFEFGREDL